MSHHPYRAGDYTFAIGKPTGYGDEVTVTVTDVLGTDCGHFYMDSAEDESDFHAMADEWLREEESPDSYVFPAAVYDPVFGRIV